MDLIFTNGEKLFLKQTLTKPSLIAEGLIGQNLFLYQKQIIDYLCENKQSDYNVYGDDFSISIIPKNIQDDAVLMIKDYDENQQLESHINIGFNKDELDQFINLLQVVRKNMK